MEAVLQYRVEKEVVAPTVTQVEPRFEPAPRVTVRWTWDMRKSSLPPGAAVDYRWRISDTEGAVVQTGWQRVFFEDDRYPWRELRSGMLRLLWHEGSDSFAEGLLEAAIEALERIEAVLGVTLEEEVAVYVYASTGELLGALIFPQEWTGGLAFVEYGVVVVAVAPSDLDWGRRALAHELAHLVVHRLIYGPLARLPSWLDEGLAMHMEGGLRHDLAAVLDEAVASDSLYSVRSLEGSFPADYAGAALAYAESWSIVDYLLQSYGEEALRELLLSFREGKTPDEALTEVYGFDEDELDARWRESLGLRAHAQV